MDGRAPDAQRTGNVSHIGNKAKRQELYAKYKKEKRKRKLARRLEIAKEERKSADGRKKRKERLKTNKPRTIENTRVYNPTVLNAANTHEGPKWMTVPKQGAGSAAEGMVDADEQPEDQDDDIDEDEEDDDEEDEEEDEDEDEDGDEEDDDEGPIAIEEDDDSAEAPQAGPDTAEIEADPRQAKYDVDDDPEANPSILITTSLPSNSTSPHLASANSRSHPAKRVREFVDELLNVFPGAEYRKRAKARGVGLGKICAWARARRYDMVVVVGESNKQPTMLTLVQLPLGPTALFRLTSISTGREIYGHARPTPHTPELILNNFTTALGHRLGGMLQHMFPKIPQLEGRQVVTAHNQRDYIFFRRHRYEFRSADKAALQEIGPRFTLKLVSMTSGLPKGAGAWDGRFIDELEDAPAAADEPKTDEAPGAHDPTDATEFKWTPRMGVSRRNFYL
ncbi:Ribosome production factor 1 [Malassezia cuniculi]|uniref:Ribosome production factor 1 n=1 Tax=Malassezia cuniculi TaxID=948313 RepID=A0AAF0F117_9BASI|nr:Ribosome production factor 1 [Malassezia cuniculi]